MAILLWVPVLSVYVDGLGLPQLWLDPFDLLSRIRIGMSEVLRSVVWWVLITLCFPAALAATASFLASEFLLWYSNAGSDITGDRQQDARFP